jgi:hypothetical protein
MVAAEVLGADEDEEEEGELDPAAAAALSETANQRKAIAEPILTAADKGAEANFLARHIDELRDNLLDDQGGEGLRQMISANLKKKAGETRSENLPNEDTTAGEIMEIEADIIGRRDQQSGGMDVARKIQEYFASKGEIDEKTETKIKESIAGVREALYTMTVNGMLSAEKMKELVSDIEIQAAPEGEDQHNRVAYFEQTTDGGVKLTLFDKFFNLSNNMQAYALRHEFGHVLLEASDIWEGDVDRFLAAGANMTAENADQFIAEFANTPEFAQALMILKDPKGNSDNWGPFLNKRLKKLADPTLQGEERQQEQKAVAKEIMAELIGHFLGSDMRMGGVLMRAVEGHVKLTDSTKEVYAPLIEKLKTALSGRGEKVNGRQLEEDFFDETEFEEAFGSTTTGTGSGNEGGGGTGGGAGGSGGKSNNSTVVGEVLDFLCYGKGVGKNN